nr:MAG TPA_asm: hypothetical protein [Bacteriophage sp.]
MKRLIVNCRYCSRKPGFRRTSRSNARKFKCRYRF